MHLRVDQTHHAHHALAAQSLVAAGRGLLRHPGDLADEPEGGAGVVVQGAEDFPVDLVNHEGSMTAARLSMDVCAHFWPGRWGSDSMSRMLWRPKAVNDRGARRRRGEFPVDVTTPASGPADRRAATLVMACLGVFVAYLPVTTVAVSLPAVQSALGATTAQLSWVQDAFVLPMAAFILTAGVVGDVHGRKKVFQAGLLFSAAGAAVALVAQSVQVLWVGQALAGLGAATLLPTTLALISHAVPDHRERGKFIGLWATSLM
ncbi:EmrB/QacA family drug resistance transporter, partial [Streptomyces sviceus ATCC 29083]